MDKIIQANIRRFKQLLEHETDPAKRATIHGLLPEEEAKLRQESPERRAASKG